MKVWFPALKVRTGAGVFATNLADGLRKSGVPAQLSWFPRIAELCPASLTWAAIPPDTDIIHANCDYAFAFAGRGAPVVATLYHWVHGADFKPHRSWLRGMYHRLLVRRFQERSLRAAAVVTTISEYSARQVCAALPDLDVRVIHPGVDTEYFTPGPSRAADGGFRLLFIGSPSRRKGIDLLPHIAALLGVGYEIRYAAGPAFPGVTNLYRTGPLTQELLREEYRTCDALIFPTRYEGFGLVAAEAMACGKPVIASRCTSLPELVVDGATGILCPVDDVAAFAAAARRLAGDRAACDAMGQAGRARVLRQFTLARMANAYIDLYRELGAG